MSQNFDELVRDDLRAQLAAVTAERDRALAAQDDRERQAGVRCGVSRDVAGCDWPDAVAEALLVARQQLAAVTAERDRLKADFESFTGHHAATERGWARDKVRLAAVRALPRYETQEIESMLGLNGHEDWVRADDLAACLDGQEG